MVLFLGAVEFSTDTSFRPVIPLALRKKIVCVSVSACNVHWSMVCGFVPLDMMLEYCHCLQDFYGLRPRQCQWHLVFGIFLGIGVALHGVPELSEERR